MFGVDPREVAQVALFSCEKLHDLHARHRFLQDRVDPRNAHADGAKRVTNTQAEDDGGCCEERHHEERREGEPCIHQEEHDRETHHLEKVCHERNDSRGEHLGHILHVVCRAGDEPTDGVAVEEAEVESQDVPEDIAAQVAHRGLPCPRHHHCVNELQQRPKHHRRQVETGKPDERRHAARRAKEPSPVLGRRWGRCSGQRIPTDRRSDHSIDPGLHDPGRSELEDEHRKNQEQGENDLAAVAPHIRP